MTLCKACNLLEGLNKGLPKLGIGKTNRLRKQFNLSPAYSLNSSNLSLSKTSQLSSLNNVNELSNNCECSDSDNKGLKCCSTKGINYQESEVCCSGQSSCVSLKTDLIVEK